MADVGHGKRDRAAWVAPAAAVAGLAGYLYVLGGIVRWVRFSAAGLPADNGVALLDDRVLFATGLRALLAAVVVVGLIVGAARVVSLRNWEKHKQQWVDGPTIDSAADKDAEMARVAAGVTMLVLSAALAVTAGGIASTLPVKKDLNDAITATVVTLAFCGLLWTFMHFGPVLLNDARLRFATVAAVCVTAAVSVMPLAVLIVVGVLLAVLGGRGAGVRSPDSLSGLLRTRLPYVLAIAYTLVALAYESVPRASYPRAVVSTTTGALTGGYIGRTSDGVYLLTCQSSLRGQSTDERLVFLPAATVTTIRLGGPAFRIDTGQRPSPLARVASWAGISNSRLTWITPELPREGPTCGADEPTPDSGGLGSKVLVDEKAHNRVRVPSNEPIISADGTPKLIADLARKYQPTIEVTAEDRFWPVAVSTVLTAKDADGRQTCLMSAGQCRSGIELNALDPVASADDYLDLPEKLSSDPTRQFQTYMRGQGFDASSLYELLLKTPAQLDPWSSAQVYTYFAGKIVAPDYYRGVPPGLYAMQYWFYYPYNYFPLTVESKLMNTQPIGAIKHSVDQHEGDWEQVTVFLDDDLKPQYLYMARHAGEGEALRWDKVRIDAPTHPIVQAAFGGHPTYPNTCRRYERPRALSGNLSDYVSCGSWRFAFRARTTALANLARAKWACWPGHFGEATPAELRNAALTNNPKSQVKVPGPRSPLRQAPNAGICDHDTLAAERALIVAHPAPAPVTPAKTLTPQPAAP